MESKLKNSNRFSFKYLFLYGISILLIIGLFIPTPYYLYQPGSAEELSSKVTVENGHKNDNGKLYLTTVLSIKASNIYYLLYGYLASHTEIKKEEEVHGDLTDREYNQLLKHMMTSSQQDAIVSSLKAAGEPVAIHPDGVFIANIIPQSKAKKVLEVGDIIVSIDGMNVQKAADFKTYLNAKKKIG
ncbi:MAG: PDZ domain-containing protein, partial [Bacillota bacterium]|nr:PDZ domain-containing protein [Bacillota bacterium]